MSELNMYIPIRDETSFMIKYYQYLFNKYWGNHVHVYFWDTNHRSLNSTTTFILFPWPIKREANPKAWSKPIIEFFNRLKMNIFILV